MIDIKILNTEKELQSFPITQSLYLLSNEELDIPSLKDHIILFRTIPEKGLVSLVEPYSYTLGYIKDKFSTSDLTFNQEQYESGYKLSITPTKTLELDSDYILYITRSLIASNVTINKNVSKSTTSDLKVSLKSPYKAKVVTLTIKTTSKLSKDSNIITFDADTYKDVVLNIAQNPSITLNNIIYTFSNTVYVAGEEFTITLTEGSKEVPEDILYKFRTAPSDSIKVISNQQPSQTINTQDILKFYQQVDTVKESLVLYPKYIAPNLFSITLPDDFNYNKDRKIVASVKEAFNNYLLTQMDLYDANMNYKIYIYQEEQELYVEVVYSDTETSILDDNGDELLYEIRRSRR